MKKFEVIQGPVITEKAQLRKDTERTLCFQVRPDATKTDIKNAVEAIFKVKVEAVRTANFPGKLRRRGKYAGYRPDWKKAYVKLREGEKMVEYAQI
ncbi:MAG: 50S ribosomal protein L23 [Acidobacteria bacterium]|nr:50S ribosomal protein L23 [Acidobacteriota bacterium]